MANNNLLANPSPVSPVGSSTQSPGGGYPPNPMDALNVNDNIARGQPATSDYFSQGIVLMVVCPNSGCGRAVDPNELGAHIQQHAAEADRSAMGRGGNFGNDDYEV